MTASALTSGNPSIANKTSSDHEVALVAVRDLSGAFWTARVTPSENGTPWQNHHGIFRSDPALVYSGRDKFLLIGIDLNSVAWSALLNDEGGIDRAWKQTGALLAGNVCGIEGPGMALLAGRDTSNVIGILRVSINGDNQWTRTGLVSPHDPGCARFGDELIVSAIDKAGELYVNHCSIGVVPKCAEWKFMGASVESAAVGVWDGSYYLFIRTADNSVARWSSATGEWRGVIWGSLARGRLIAPPSTY